jgi:hypothetical protein
MNSLILELQKDSLNNKLTVTNLLRKAFVVAKKLHVQEFIVWIEKELNGYVEAEDLPKYREVSGQVMVHNPFHGWQPVIFESSEEAEILASKNVFSPIGEIENLCNASTENSVTAYPLPDRTTKNIMKSTTGLVPHFIANESQMNGIIEAVRNIVLDWALKMEAEGITGDNLIFTEQEKLKASSNIFHIGTFSGIIGDISGSQIQFGDYNSIHSELKKLGVPQSERIKLEELMDGYEVSNKENKKSLVSKAMEWLKRNGKTIGNLSETIRRWFEITA